MKAQKSLYLNGGEILRVEQTDGETKFLVLSNDGCGLKKVSYLEFMEVFKKLAYVFITSWDEKLVEEYKECNKFMEKL